MKARHAGTKVGMSTELRACFVRILSASSVLATEPHGRSLWVGGRMRGCVVVVRLLAGYGSGRGAVLANLGARVVGRAMKLEKASRSWLFFQRSRRRAAALGFWAIFIIRGVEIQRTLR